MKRIAAPLMAAMVSGCVSMPIDGTARSHYYFGLVRVEYPGSRGRLIAIDVKSLGIGFDGAAVLGWRDSKFVYADPKDCGVVIIVRDKLETAQVAQLVGTLGENACVADFSGSLPPH